MCRMNAAEKKLHIECLNLKHITIVASADTELLDQVLGLVVHSSDLLLYFSCPLMRLEILILARAGC